jgi:2-keto-4-pentenoate hydratase/2-oxohepta-3-ene-1,7-dioic acid hydratase in catechol pathway
MRVYQYRSAPDQVSLAIARDGLVIDPHLTLKASGKQTDTDLRALRTSLSLIQAGEQGMQLARQALDDAARTGAGVVDLANLRLCTPIHATTLLCSGSNYLDHNAEKVNIDISGKEPEFFVKPSDCVIGPGEPLQLSNRLTRKLDAETELAIVMGGPAKRNIEVGDALRHVWGYTVANDLTARDLQVRFRADGTVWYEVGRGKVFDGAAPLGPCIVTVDEIPDPQKLAIRTRVNGELRQNGSTSKMIFTVADIVHFFSISMTLKPGIVLLTGTPAGTSWSADAELGGRWSPGNGIVKSSGYLKEGDIVEAEIEGIGVLRNQVALV